VSSEASFKRLHEAIQRWREALTATERRIASHLLEAPRSVALMSIQELASSLGTGPASIVRLAKKLGYEGYSDLKRDLKQELREGGSPLERFKLALESPGSNNGSSLHAIARQEIENLTTTLELVDATSLASAVAIVSRASLVCTAGVGISSHLASMAAFVLQRIGLRAFPVQQTGLDLSEQLVSIRKGAVLLAFSFPPYSSQTIDAAAFAKAQGAAVLGITNSKLSPLVKHCDLVLVAKTDSNVPSNSLSAPLMLIHGIAAAVASSRRRSSSKAIERTISLRKRGA
jgi:DNA-binding MurR/RpiR family transcriptional regulator